MFLLPLWITTLGSRSSIQERLEDLMNEDRTVNKCGPNTQQVERFVAELGNLGEREWGMLATGWQYRADLEEIKAQAPIEANGWLDTAFTELDGIGAAKGRPWARCLQPVVALTLVDHIEPHQFALLYGRFQELIPVEKLGAGKAPLTDEQIASVFEFASAIEGERAVARAGERSLPVLLLTFAVAVAGVVSLFAGGDWALLALASIATLFVVGLWGQRIETSWTMPWRKD